MKYCDEIVVKICKLLEDGNNRSDSSILSGITYETFRSWTHEHPAFSLAVKEAEARCIQSHIANVKKAGDKSWQASAWWLERKRPEEFALKYRPDDKRDEDTAMRLASKTLELMAKFNANGIIPTEPSRI